MLPPRNSTHVFMAPDIQVSPEWKPLFFFQNFPKSRQEITVQKERSTKYVTINFSALQPLH